MTVRYRSFDDHYPEPSRPREAKGGVKARTQRGAFGNNWWARRWSEVLDGFHLGQRLSRGRSYARQGQVLAVEVGEGVVKAQVQGSRPRPYRVTIKVKTLSAADWERVARSLASQAAQAAELLAGRLPEGIEGVFAAAAVSLFPARSHDLQTDCTCPDWSNPCKHVAAVYCLLAEEFDRDPFLIFKLRGMTREGLVELIGGGGAAVKAPEPEVTEDLPTDPSRFWGQPGESYAGGTLDSRALPVTEPDCNTTVAGAPTAGAYAVSVPVVAAALVRRLGGFPFWRGEEPFLTAVERVYRGASLLGMDVFVGEWRQVPASGQTAPGQVEPASLGSGGAGRTPPHRG